tara:strand:- start:150 stop:353 length:204 start_codon:yes stop_codon:yes gene_type:complete
MTIDKYTKFILTLIAVGILGLNFHLFKGDIVKNAYASSGLQKITICNESGRCGYGTASSPFKVEKFR